MVRKLTPIERAVVELDARASSQGWHRWRWDWAGSPFSREGLDYAVEVLKAATPNGTTEEVRMALLIELAAVQIQVARPIPLGINGFLSKDESDRLRAEEEKGRLEPLRRRATNVRAVLEYVGTPRETICEYGRSGLVVKPRHSSLVRQAVRERDGERCTVPGCNQQGEHLHHINWTIAMRALPEDLQVVCAQHNYEFERKN